MHDFEDLDLDEFEAAAIAVDEVSEEIQQLRLIIRRLILLLNRITHELNQLKHLRLIIQHVLIIIIHLFEKIHTPHISLNMLYEFGNLVDHDDFDLVEVLDESDDELVA